MRALAARAFATCALAFAACAQEPVEPSAPAIPTPAPPALAQLDFHPIVTASSNQLVIQPLGHVVVKTDGAWTSAEHTQPTALSLDDLTTLPSTRYHVYATIETNTLLFRVFTTPPDGARRFAEGNDHFRHVSTFATASIGGLLSYAQIGRVYQYASPVGIIVDEETTLTKNASFAPFVPEGAVSVRVIARATGSGQARIIAQRTGVVLGVVVGTLQLDLATQPEHSFNYVTDADTRLSVAAYSFVY